jgi:AcrR family transcriptional regulator
LSDAGLTNGAFYAHFMSKEDLVANVLADQLRAQRQTFDAQPPEGQPSAQHQRAGRVKEHAVRYRVLGSPLVESTTIILISGKSCS